MAYTWHAWFDWNNDGILESDEANRLLRLTTLRGRKSLLDAPYVGKATLTLDNSDQRFNPWNVSSPLYGNVKPGRRVKITVTIGGTTYSVFTGRIDLPKQIISTAGAAPREIVITAMDGWDWLRSQRVNVALFANILTGDAIVEVLSAAGWIESGVWILGTSALGSTTVLGGAGYSEQYDINAGVDTIPYWFTEDESAAAAVNDLIDSELGRAEIDADGKFIFRSRWASFGAAADVVLTDAMISEVAVPTPWEGVKNLIRITVNPRNLTTTQVIWSTVDVPSIVAGGSVTIWAEFRDANGARSPATSVVTPVAMTDYTANSAANGSGTDLTANISIVITKFSSTAELVVTNSAAVTAYLTFLQLRGVIVQALSSHAIIQEDATSEATWGKRDVTRDLRWQQSTDHANDLALYLLSRLKDPQVNPSVYFETRDESLEYDVGDKVGWNSSVLGFDLKFRITEIEHKWLADGGQKVQTRWGLAQPIFDDFWVLGTSALGIDTRLGI